MSRNRTNAVLGYTAEDVDLTLTEYEARYGWSSAEFMRDWRAGRLDHGDLELSRWALLIGVRDRASEAEGKR